MESENLVHSVSFTHDEPLSLSSESSSSIKIHSDSSDESLEDNIHVSNVRATMDTKNVTNTPKSGPSLSSPKFENLNNFDYSDTSFDNTFVLSVNTAETPFNGKSPTSRSRSSSSKRRSLSLSSPNESNINLRQRKLNSSYDFGKSYDGFESSSQEGEHEGSRHQNENHSKLDISIGSNWSSALAVSSLHKAYVRLKFDNRALRRSLKCSENRCSKLLKQVEYLESNLGLTSLQNQKENKNMVSNEAKEESSDSLHLRLKEEEEKVKAANAEISLLLSEIEKFKTLAQISFSGESSESKNNKLNITDVSKSISAMQRTLDETSEEKMALLQEIERLSNENNSFQNLVETLKKGRVSDLKVISVKRLYLSIVRMTNRFLYRSFRKWVYVDSELKKREEVEKVKILSRRRLAENAIKHLKRKHRSFYFDTWKKVVSDSKRLRDIAHKYILRLKSQKLYSCYSSWKEFVYMRKRVKKLMHRTILRLDNLELSRCFQSWQGFVNDLRASDNKNALEVEKDRHDMIKKELEELKALHEWTIKQHKIDMDKVNAAARQRAMKVVSLWQNKLLLSVFVRMKEYAQEQKRNRHLCNKMINKMMKQTQNRCFYSWKENVNEQVHERKLLKKTAKVFMNRIAKKALYTWTEFAQQQKSERGKLLKFASRWRNRTYSKIFRQWCEFVQEKQEMKEKARRILLAVQADDLLARFNQWKFFVIDMKEERARYQNENQIAHRVAMRIMKAKLARTFDNWKSVSQKAISDRNRIRKFLFIMKNRKVGSSFSTWNLFVENRKFCRRIVSRLLISQSNKILFSGFNSWKRFHQNHEKYTVETLIQDLRREKEELEKKVEMLVWEKQTMERDVSEEVKGALKLQQEHRDRMVRKIVARLQGKSLRTYFNGFKQYVKDQVRSRLLLKRYVQKLQHRQMIGLFASWRENVVLLKKNRLIMEKTMLKMNRNLSLKAFGTWYDNYMHEKNARLKASRVLARFRMKLQVQSFNAWVSFYEEKKDQKEKAHKIIRAAIQNGKHARFDQWKQFVKIEKEKRYKIQELERKAEWVQRFGNKRRMRIVLSEWKEYVLLCLNRKADIRRVMGAWSQSTKNKAFRSWLDTVERCKANRKLAQKVFNRMSKRYLATGFRTWIGYLKLKNSLNVSTLMGELDEKNKEIERLRSIIEENRALHNSKKEKLDKDIEALKQENEQRKKVLAKSFVNKWKNRTLYSTFTCWKDEVNNMVRLKATCSRIVLRIQKRSQSKCFDSWVHFCSSSKRQRTIAEKALKRMKNAKLAMVLARWSESVREQINTRRKMNIFISKWKNATIRKIFDGWRVNVDDVKEAKKNAKRIIMQMKNKKLSLVWRKWNHCISIQKENQKQFDTLRIKCLYRMKVDDEACIRMSFVAWKDRMISVHVLRNKIRELLGKKVVRTARRILNAWSEYTSIATNGRQTAKRLLFRLKIRYLRHAWLKLGVLNERSLFQDELKQLRLTSDYMGNEINEWKAKLAQSQMSKAQYMLFVHGNSKRSRAFRAWRVYVTKTTCRRKLLMRCVCIRMSRSVYISFGKLKEFLFTNRLNDTRIRIFDLKMEGSLRRKCFYRWFKTCIVERRLEDTSIERKGLRLSIVSNILKTMKMRRMYTAMRTWKYNCLTRVDIEHRARLKLRMCQAACLDILSCMKATSLPHLIDELESNVHKLFQSESLSMFVLHENDPSTLFSPITQKYVGFGQGMIGQVAQSGKLLAVDDVRQDTRYCSEIDINLFSSLSERGCDHFSYNPKHVHLRSSPQVQIAMITLPIFDVNEDGKILGVLQVAKRINRNRNSGVYEPEVNGKNFSVSLYLELSSSVLSIIARTIAFCVDICRRLKQADSEKGALLTTIQKIEDRRRAESLRAVEELQIAYDRVAVLEAKCGKVKRLEKELKGAKQVLKDWDKSF